MQCGLATVVLMQEACQCQMEGLGVYLAREPKALLYAMYCMVPVPDSDEFEGAVVECEVCFVLCTTAAWRQNRV